MGRDQFCKFLARREFLSPGSKVHASGVPFDDASGDRLRDWLGLDRKTFYDAKRVAILPMGFCYPGTGASLASEGPKPFV